MAHIDDSNRRGAQDAYTNSSRQNQLLFTINQMLTQVLQTSFLARVDKCTSQEEKSGSLLIDCTPLISQTDTESTSLPMTSLLDIPHVRQQQGIAAFIVDPVPGDIMLLSVSKHDISNIKQGTTESAPPASSRNFSQSDAIAAGAVHTQKPTNFIVLRQDNTLYGESPDGYEWKTNKDTVEKIGENHVTDIGKDETTNIHGSQTVTIDKDMTLTVKNNSTVTVNGQSDTSVDGNFSLTVKGNGEVRISGTVNVTVDGNVTVKAPSVTIDSPTVSCTGNVSVKGNVTANGDVKAGSISLKSHTHGGVKPGPGNTSGPQ